MAFKLWESGLSIIFFHEQTLVLLEEKDPVELGYMLVGLHQIYSILFTSLKCSKKIILANEIFFIWTPKHIFNVMALNN